jgi:drug/metabolite transporter (DMT)-like permease
LLRDLKALPAAAVTCLGASVTFWALTLAGDRITLPDTVSRVSILLALTLFSTILPIVTLFAAIPRLGVARAALMSSVEPVITLALSALVLGERFSAPQVAGAVLIVGSVGLSYREGA